MPAAPDSIDIVGALAHTPIDAERIARVLDAAPETLVHGGRFTGRPHTRIRCADGLVVKLRDELRFSARDARRWIDAALARERALGVHHPAKTWFVLHEGSEARIANATPQLRPLHEVVDANAARFVEWLGDVLDRYIAVAAHHALRLDEGLSNFGIDADGAVHYLDDDTYAWDGFVSLAEMLGVWIRQRGELDDTGAAHVGQRLRAAILREFDDAHACVVLAENLRGVLMVTPRQNAARDACIAALSPPRKRACRPRGARFALLADVHANLPALRAVLAALRAQGVDEGVVMGDVVGYGPHPAPCIADLKESGFAVLKGNHDHAVASGKFQDGFSPHGRWVAEWTRATLGAAQRAWLDELPPYLQDGAWLAVHGAPIDRTFFNAYVYSRTSDDNLDNLAQRNIRFCFHGHSHVRGVFFDTKRERGFCNDDRVDLRSARHALICPGSVGQPRSGTGGIAEFAVFDVAAQAVEFHSAAYDVEATLADMHALGFPDVLQHRLRQGQ